VGVFSSPQPSPKERETLRGMYAKNLTPALSKGEGDVVEVDGVKILWLYFVMDDG